MFVLLTGGCHPHHPSLPTWLPTSEAVGFSAEVENRRRNLRDVKTLQFQ